MAVKTFIPDEKFLTVSQNAEKGTEFVKAEGPSGSSGFYMITHRGRVLNRFVDDNGVILASVWSNEIQYHVELKLDAKRGDVVEVDVSKELFRTWKDARWAKHMAAVEEELAHNRANFF